MPNYTVIDVPQDISDKAMQQGIAMVHDDEYRIYYDDILKLMKPYHVNKRSDSKSGIWYMCWWDDNNYRKSTRTTNYQLAKDVAAEMWEEHFAAKELVCKNMNFNYKTVGSGGTVYTKIGQENSFPGRSGRLNG